MVTNDPIPLVRLTTPAPINASGLSRRIQRILQWHRKNKRKVYDGPEHFAYLPTDPYNHSAARGIIGIATQGCTYARSSWAGCAVCGHNASTLWREDISDTEILIDFERSITALSAFKPPVLSLYCSGSFLDSFELPEAVRSQIITRVAKLPWVETVMIETMPQFVRSSTLQRITNALSSKRLTIGIGLDSSNELVRSICFQRHASTQHYIDAVSVCRELSVSTIAYIVHGAPFLSLGESIFDTATSLRDALEIFGFDAVSIEPVALQVGTIQELFRQMDSSYVCPDIWSLAESLASYANISSLDPQKWATNIVIGGQVFTPLPTQTVQGCNHCLRLIDQQMGHSVAKVLSTLPTRSSGLFCQAHSRSFSTPFSESVLLNNVASRLSLLEQAMPEYACARNIEQLHCNNNAVSVS